MTNNELIEKAACRIARREAETLLLHVARKDRAWLLAHPEAEVRSPEAITFLDLVGRREAQTPLQYLTGHQEFFGLDLEVSPAVLIPRPETELLVEAVLHWVRDREATGVSDPRILDVGTGSGAIALALAKQHPRAEVWAVDLSPAALAVAQSNASRLGLRKRVRFLQSDLLDVVKTTATPAPRFDVVVSNPPYVPQADAPSLQPEVRDHEPHLALFAGADGLEIYRRLIPQAHAALRPGGLLALEFGFGQREALQTLLRDWTAVRFLDDYAGIPRCAFAERAHPPKPSS